MIVGEQDTVTLTGTALAAYNRALEPKRLVTIPGGHFAPYTTEFARASAAATAFFRDDHRRHLGLRSLRRSHAEVHALTYADPGDNLAAQARADAAVAAWAQSLTLVKTPRQGFDSTPAPRARRSAQARRRHGAVPLTLAGPAGMRDLIATWSSTCHATAPSVPAPVEA
ncbi:hypothetical protein AB5J72_07660 [Streptomyces sp. CG1]|uniref:hypothetical protein n=1 Tax=Streptomyces sp. CG1 TaxID=1287523 RepID=UPI0034E24BD6